jgi:hypothetical protein
MDQTTEMKLLLEAVDVPKVDHPKKAYANQPNEQTLDSATQQNFGDDLHKKKSYQHPSRDGDNARASKLIQYNLEEKRLSVAFKKFKLNESAEADKWSSRKELYNLVDQAIGNAGPDLHYSVTKEYMMAAIERILDGDTMGATDELMQDFTDHNGGERRDHDIYAEELNDELDWIVSNRIEEALETQGDSSGESAKLKKLHQAESDQLDGVTAKVFGPTEAYPAPWTLKHVGGKYPIYAIKASNRAEVATWLNQTDAQAIVDEVNQ